MQIFVQLLSGKTVCMDVTNDTLVADVVTHANSVDVKDVADVKDADVEGNIESKPRYHGCIYLRGFYEAEHPMMVQSGEVLPLERLLRELYLKQIIKEIVLLAY